MLPLQFDQHMVLIPVYFTTKVIPTPQTLSPYAVFLSSQAYKNFPFFSGIAEQYQTDFFNALEVAGQSFFGGRSENSIFSFFSFYLDWLTDAFRKRDEMLAFKKITKTA